jgi:hypothetical protein
MSPNFVEKNEVNDEKAGLKPRSFTAFFGMTEVMP